MASISVSLDRNADRHDVKLLKRELDTLPGVTSVSVSSGGQLAVDYDASASRVNQENRIKLMLAVAKERLNAPAEAKPLTAEEIAGGAPKAGATV